AGDDLEAVAAGGPAVVVGAAVDEVPAEDATEQEDFGAEEEPHAEGGALLLLLHVVEVVREPRRVRRVVVRQVIGRELTHGGRSLRSGRIPSAPAGRPLRETPSRG